MLAVQVASLEVKFDCGTDVIYASASLDDLKKYITVTAVYNDGNRVENVTNYVLGGKLEAGVTDVTVRFGGASETISVSVTEVKLAEISAQFVQNDTKIFATATAEDILKLIADGKVSLTVSGVNNDGSAYAGGITGYTISGIALTADGKAEVTVVYEGLSCKFTMELTAVAITGIRVSFEPGDAKITTGNSRDDLRNYLTVTAVYNDGSEVVLDKHAYVLEGDMGVGTAAIKVTYNGMEEYFTVKVEAADGSSGTIFGIDWKYIAIGAAALALLILIILVIVLIVRRRRPALSGGSGSYDDEDGFNEDYYGEE